MYTFLKKHLKNKQLMNIKQYLANETFEQKKNFQEYKSHENSASWGGEKKKKKKFFCKKGGGRPEQKAGNRNLPTNCNPIRDL